MKGALAFFAIAAAVIVSGCISQESQSPGPGNNTQAAEYTLAEVAMHSAADDCWMVIHGKVYDVTAWVPQHPGGQAILQGCGEDATDLFETRPMGSGTPHSERARSILQNYYIGNLSGGG